MNIATLLTRARTEVLEPGASVRLDGTSERGRVAFIDCGWIYWATEDGAGHATPEKFIVLEGP